MLRLPSTLCDIRLSTRQKTKNKKHNHTIFIFYFLCFMLIK